MRDSLDIVERPPDPSKPRADLDWRIGGVLLGLLLTLAVGIAKPIGVSSAFCTSWGMVLKEVSPRWAAASPYLKIVGTVVTYEWMLVLGVALGGLAAALTSRSRAGEAVPATWSERFGPSVARRFLGAFAGGVLFLFGAPEFVRPLESAAPLRWVARLRRSNRFRGERGGGCRSAARRITGRRTTPASGSPDVIWEPHEHARVGAKLVGRRHTKSGARLAGGCTSGHIVSGMSQLAVSGFVFAAAVFASGMLVARLLYGRGPTP